MEKKQTNVVVVTVAIFVATFMSAIEGTIVSTAMPTIVGDLHGVSLMNWVISIFLLTNAIFTPIYGKLSDIFGRKRVFIFGIIIFLIGSMLSGMAHSMGFLIYGAHCKESGLDRLCRFLIPLLLIFIRLKNGPR
ncbi:Dethiobiotin synthase [Pediococcus pentosaceus]|uniref:Dethiobiotin synthase n=1 Tax=Pediococcus pentosaceus TaxID=1255 RepID=A0A1Y0W005_PEDPE|nr:Dethiobiotin synthase [Pediococcus pentosaceus]